MAPSVLLVFALRIIFAPFVLSQSGAVPQVLCGFTGPPYNNHLRLTAADVPERCKDVAYHDYYIDYPMNDADKEVISSLVSAQINVYVSVSFKEDQHWADIMNANGTNPYCNDIEAMKTFLNNNKISGIILDQLGFWDGDITGYPAKLNTFIGGIKAAVPNLKVGVVLPAWKYTEYGKKNLFDFAVTDSTVDFYEISLSSLASACTSSANPRYPITSDVDDLIGAVATTGINQNKLMVGAVVAVFTGGSKSVVMTYSEYCIEKGQDSSVIYCTDTIQILYDLATYLKQHFKGLMLLNLDLDDWNDSCGCGKFPVSNAYIDSWLSVPVTCCPAIGG